jgi:hypothetical protein
LEASQHSDQLDSTYLYLKENITHFNTPYYSIIQNHNYIQEFLTYLYWSSWQCNFRIGQSFGLTFPIKDQLVLKPNTKYKILITPLERKYDNNLIILSNSLQTIDPNYIEFTTEKASKKVIKKPLSIFWINNIIGEKRREELNISYKLN